MSPIQGGTKFSESTKFHMLEWPGNNPDLNLIENLWSTMKRKVAEQQSYSFLGLQHATKKVWVKNLDVKYSRELILSMLKRIKSVIKCKGGHTKH